MKIIEGGVCAAKGFKAGAMRCGIRKSHTKKDLAMILSDCVCNASAVYTTNRVKASPILLTKEHLADGKAQAVIVNSGNANACAPFGMENARRQAKAGARALGVSEENVIVASTGVIGQTLPVEAIEAHAGEMEMKYDNSLVAAEAIMTTDTKVKTIAVEFDIDGTTCHIGGICKGSGMIHPNMGTMLCFITTDCAVSSEMIRKALLFNVKRTFNRVTVDGDTSTNDTLIIMASGLAGNPEICEENADYAAFVAALTAIAEHMCAEHAGDGEGATHLITCEVTHAPDLKTARAVSRSVVCSNLFKAAVFGRDANWGRILCAIGYTPGDFSIDKVCVWLSSKAGEVYVCENAAYHPYSEDEAAKVLAEHDVLVKVDMGTGEASAKAWGCDLTYDYVKINGDYRT